MNCDSVKAKDDPDPVQSTKNLGLAKKFLIAAVVVGIVTQVLYQLLLNLSVVGEGSPSGFVIG